MADADVIVLGGGVIGLTTAVLLAEAGAAVRVWTREPAARSTSAVAGGLWGRTAWPRRPRRTLGRRVLHRLRRPRRPPRPRPASAWLTASSGPRQRFPPPSWAAGVPAPAPPPPPTSHPATAPATTCACRSSTCPPTSPTSPAA